MTVPKSVEDEGALETAREEAKRALLASCEDFRVAQVRAAFLRVCGVSAPCGLLHFALSSWRPRPSARYLLRTLAYLR